MDVRAVVMEKYDFGKIELEHFEHGLLSFYLFSLTAKAPEKLHIPKGEKVVGTNFQPGARLDLWNFAMSSFTTCCADCQFDFFAKVSNATLERL